MTRELFHFSYFILIAPRDTNVGFGPTSYRHSLPCVTYSPCSEARQTVPQHTTSAHPLPPCGHNSTDSAHELLRITLQRMTAPRAYHCLLPTASRCLGTS